MSWPRQSREKGDNRNLVTIQQLSGQRGVNGGREERESSFFKIKTNDILCSMLELLLYNKQHIILHTHTLLVFFGIPVNELSAKYIARGLNRITAPLETRETGVSASSAGLASLAWIPSLPPHQPSLSALQKCTASTFSFCYSFHKILVLQKKF